jgi:hypothetical protein
MLGRISTIIEIIVNCIVCEREIGILASSRAMGLGLIIKIIVMKIYDSGKFIYLLVTKNGCRISAKCRLFVPPGMNCS